MDETFPGWMTGSRSFHLTELNGVAVRAKVGATDVERHPDYHQLVLVDVALFRHGGSLNGVGLEACMDYHPIYQHVMGWESREHTDLLETLAEDLIKLCLRDASVEACRVRIRKPHIYHNVADAGVTLYRRREPR